MAKIDELKDKGYFTLTGEDLLGVAREMKIKIENLKAEDLDFVADKTSNSLDWWIACREAWHLWKERKAEKK